MVAANSAAYAIHNGQVLTLAPLAQGKPKARITAEDLGLVDRGSIVVENGIIACAGSFADCSRALQDVRSRQPLVAEHDAAGKIVMPGFIDAHTHALFAGNRVADFEALIAGEKAPLGMSYTIQETRRCSLDGLIALGAGRLRLMLEHGTTTAEVKSGYALTADGECRLLEALHALGQQSDLPRIVPTFCGAHALPPEFQDYDAFVDELNAVILPKVAQQGYARFADAFCETGFFTPQQSEKFLRACADRKLLLRIHADELHHSGGAQVAARLRCVSADHLNFADEQDITGLAAAATIAVLCPGTAEYLGLERIASARALIDAGVPVALATDFNPGTCPSFSLQMIAYLARRHFKLQAPEILAGMTIQAAHSLALASELGSLTAGKRADVVVLNVEDYREVGYFFGVNLVNTVFRAPAGF